MRTKFHIGCSSFNESNWKGIFYPEDLPAGKRFFFYTERFGSYEMNGTFYKFPTLKTLENWYAKAPDGFLFSVKAPKIITHFKKFADCGQELTDFYSVCQNGLKEKLSCVLFQLPPSFRYDAEKLELLVDAMNPDFKNVIEFRHESWWHETVFETLSKNNITFCSVNFPKLPTTIIKTAKTGYLRFHGSPKLFYSKYTDAELSGTFQEIMAANFEEIHVYFNNTASAAGIENALAFQNLANEKPI